MIIDKKGKLFGKVSIIDIFVLLVIIIGIAGVFVTKTKLDNEKLFSDDSKMLIQTSAAKDKLEIKLKVKEVRDVTRDSIIVGDDVYLVANDKVLGTVSRVESEPAVRDVVSDDGTVFAAVVPDRFDVTIVVDADGKKKDEGYYTDSNIHLLYGREMEIKTSTIQTTPKVDQITVTQTSK